MSGLLIMGILFLIVVTAIVLIVLTCTKTAEKYANLGAISSAYNYSATRHSTRQGMRSSVRFQTRNSLNRPERMSYTPKRSMDSVTELSKDEYKLGKEIEDFIKNQPNQRWNGWKIVPEELKVSYKVGEPAKLAPIIIVPGLGGSILYTKWNFSDTQYAQFQEEVGHNPLCFQKQETWEQIWPSINGVKPDWTGASCWRYRVEPLYDPYYGFINKPGVDVSPWRIPPINANGDLEISDDFGGTTGVDILLKIGGISLANMFHNPIMDFRTNGYVDKESLFGAPYDFRRITSKDYSKLYFSALKKLIEYAVDRNGKKAIILSHSLGCTTFKLFLSSYLPSTMGAADAQSWKDEYLQIWMPIGAPFGGAPKSLRIIVSGDHMGMGHLCIAKDCNYWYQKFEKSISGVIWMVPNDTVFQGVDILPGTSYNVPDDQDDLKKLYDTVDADNALLSMDSLPPIDVIATPPLVKVLAINGASNDTAMQYEYENIHSTDIEPNDNPINTDNIAYKERATYNSFITDPVLTNKMQKEIMAGVPVEDMIGDDTVPWISLNLPRIWQEGKSKENILNGKYFKVDIKTFVGPEMVHKEMIDELAVRDFIMDNIFENQVDV